MNTSSKVSRSYFLFKQPALSQTCGWAVLNYQMRRIDLFCKLAGPLTISLIDGVSTKAAILATLGMNVISVVGEYYAIAKVRS
jgi:Ferroportin1 (FPN1)